MKLHTLKPAQGSVKKEKRIGRGDGSGHGGTSTKGTKGAQSRAGYKRKFAHEGGQMPIQRRLPKRGFKNIHRIEHKIFNLGQIAKLIEKYDIKEFNFENLYNLGLVSKTDKIKVLSVGEFQNQMNFKVNSASKNAITKIEQAGGKVEIIK